MTTAILERVLEYHIKLTGVGIIGLLYNVITSYFPQSYEWSSMWESAQNLISSKPHTVRIYDYKGTQIYCYEYPYRFNSTYIHISCAIEYNELTNHPTDLQEFWKKILDESGALFLKINFQPTLEDVDLTIYSNNIKNPLHIYHTKNIQIYGSTYTLNLQDIAVNQTYDIHNVDNITTFLTDTNQFWLQRSKDIRNSNRRALKSLWVIKSNFGQISSDANRDLIFEDWYSIYTQTAQRQEFHPHPKTYMKSQWQLEHTRAFVLYNVNEDGESIPVSCWLGFLHNNMLTYLHGGNLEAGFSIFSQYLAHVIAIMIAVNESCEYYDLGGYIKGSGFAQFKDKYKGEVVYFPGPIDITTTPLKYTCVETFPNLLKNIKKKFRH